MSVDSKAKLFVHIGGAKCGSSTIQLFMKSNVAKLYRQGFIVPDVDMRSGGECIGEQLQYFENCKDSMGDAGLDLSERLIALRDEYYSKSGESEQPVIIVSAENLSCWNNFAELFDGLGNEFDVKVLLYIRRQDDYYVSFWQQWYLKTNDDFWAWVLHSLKWIGDWSSVIEPWVNILGEENIIIRRFSRKYFKGGDLLADFSNALGINIENMTCVINENPSYCDGVTFLASSVRDVFDGMHDNEFYKMMAEWGGPPIYKKHLSQVMNQSQRKALLNYFDDSNAKIKEQYFHSESGELFEPLIEEDQKTDDSGSVEGRVEILIRLIFGCYKETVQNRSVKLHSGFLAQHAAAFFKKSRSS